MKMQRQGIVRVLALVLIAAAIPRAIFDTIETGRADLSSSQFPEDVARRSRSPMRFRFILQPTLAILAGVRGGLADARAGSPPCLFGLFSGAGGRRDLLRTGLAAIGTLLSLGIVPDLVHQQVVEHTVHPGAALVVGPILICTPCALARALTARAARWLAAGGT